MSWEKPRCNFQLNIYQRPNTTKVLFFCCQLPIRHKEPDHHYRIRVGVPEKDGKDFFISVSSNSIDKIK